MRITYPSRILLAFALAAPLAEATDVPSSARARAAIQRVRPSLETDAGIEEIFAIADAALRAGQPLFHVDVFPFRMTRESMQAHSGDKWYRFWENLREGYDYFERTRRPADVLLRHGRYTFGRS